MTDSQDISTDPRNANIGTVRGQGMLEHFALEGVQVPVTAKWNEDLLRAAGFRNVECYWRWMNFAAWVAVKPAKVAT